MWSPMSIFSTCAKLSRQSIANRYKTTEIWNSTHVWQQQHKAPSVFRHVLNFPGVFSRIFTKFSIERIRKETRHLLKFVDLSRK